MSHANILSPIDLPSPSARPVPRRSRGDGWNILADIEVFIFAVEAELEAMDRERVGVHRRGCKPDLGLRRRVIGLIWMLTFGGMGNDRLDGGTGIDSATMTALRREAVVRVCTRNKRLDQRGTGTLGCAGPLPPYRADAFH